MEIQTLADLLAEIKLLMRYGVPEEQLAETIQFLEKHSMDRIAMNVFREFYSFLPEARDDSIRSLRLLGRKEGKFLLAVTTDIDSYTYLTNAEASEFLGPVSEGIWEEEILAFFGYKDRNAFIEQHRDLSAFPFYIPASLDNTLCPICHAAEGELHSLGCSFEICPWCGGQLTKCECRFEQLGKDRLDRESHIDPFLEKLTAKGRIPFRASEQRLDYPATPADLGVTGR